MKIESMLVNKIKAGEIETIETKDKPYYKRKISIAAKDDFVTIILTSAFKENLKIESIPNEDPNTKEIKNKSKK